MIGIVILNYKNYQDTINCVKSVKENGIKDGYRFYIVDNASPNDSFSKLKKEYLNDETVTLLRSDKNGGYSYGNNIGFKKAIEDKCDYVLCVNSDVSLKENAINVLQETLIANDEIALVGPKVYHEDGSVQNCNRAILTAKLFILERKGFSWLDFSGKLKKFHYEDYDYSHVLMPTGMVSGCCFLIRAKVLEEIGFLDEGVFLYHEEDILGAKLRKINKKVALNPKAEIIHAEGKSTGRTGPMVRMNTLYGGLYYLYKYTETKKSAFNFAFFVSKLMLLFKAVFDKEYRKYYKEFVTKVKNLKRTKGREFNVKPT